MAAFYLLCCGNYWRPDRHLPPQCREGWHQTRYLQAHAGLQVRILYATGFLIDTRQESTTIQLPGDLSDLKSRSEK